MTRNQKRKVTTALGAVSASRLQPQAFLFAVTEIVTYEVKGWGRSSTEAAKDAGRRFRPCGLEDDLYTQFVAVEDRAVGLANAEDSEEGTPELQDFSAEFEQGMEEVS
ncbi:MAG TPA: hypothetical protein VG206_14455 [Terriglobia bacterium]|nr:hypothetical protein [Terriglobia bacterium]